MTAVRSMTHSFPLHGVAYATTGVPHIDVPMELNPRDGRHWPFVGSRRRLPSNAATSPIAPRTAVPTNIALPFPFSSQALSARSPGRPYGAVPRQRLQPCD